MCYGKRTMNLDTVIYVNGEIIKRQDAVISVYDRGFRFGDGVFETIRLGGIDGLQPYQWGLHLKRMEEGLSALSIAMPLHKQQQQWLKVIHKLIEKNKHHHGIVRIAASRGVDWQPKGYMPSSNKLSPTIVIETLPAPADIKQPLSLWLGSICKPSRKTLPVTHKIAALGINSMLAKQQAITHKCDDALLLNGEGFLSEASSANLFWVNKQGALCTPSDDCDCLAGTTREAIVRLTKKSNLCEVKQLKAKKEVLTSAQTIFLTNTSWGIVEISRIEQSNSNVLTNNTTQHGKHIINRLRALLEQDRLKTR